MTNQQFIDYLKERIEAVKGGNPSDKDQQLEMLTSALKLMTHGTGPARRRFRRDYERRLHFKLEMKQEMERLRLVDGLVKQEIEK